MRGLYSYVEGPSLLHHICPACGSYEVFREGLQTWESAREPVDGELRQKAVTYGSCPRCGLIGKFPMPNELELQRYYGEAWQYETQRPGYREAAVALLRGMLESDGAGAFPVMAGPGMGATHVVGDATVLDVGSKGNELVRELQKLGFNLTSGGGIDAQPKREGVVRAWLGSGDISPAHHSIVSAAHVLEHVLRPEFFMADLAALTADDGYIYIEVPSLRGSVRDLGLCDDINRNHLWHFTLPCLARLGSQVGTVTLLETDTSLPGWPVDRMVVKKRPMTEQNLSWLSSLHSDLYCEYDKAAAEIERAGHGCALYGASHSYAALVEVRPTLMQWRIFDEYKAGQTFRHGSLPERTKKIERLAGATYDGDRTIWVTTRSYNSYIDIKRWLNLNHPAFLVKTPYGSLAEAVGEVQP